MGRYVKKLAFNFAVFTEKTNSNQKLRYIYDQTDTNDRGTEVEIHP